MLVEALLLGVSTGTYCAVFCFPVALPMILSEEQRNWKENATRVGVFLFGRLVAYVAVGFILGLLGAYSLPYVDPWFKRNLSALAYLVIGAVMAATGFLHTFPDHRACSVVKKAYRPERGAFIYGMMTGLSICPPFFAAAARAFAGAEPLSGALYFLFFFMGTSVFFMPLFGFYLINNHMNRIRTVSRLAILFLGIYFFVFQGILGFVQG